MKKQEMDLRDVFDDDRPPGLMAWPLSKSRFESFLDVPSVPALEPTEPNAQGAEAGLPLDREADTHEADPRIMEGWTRRSWRERLLYLAAGCRVTHPARSAELRAWAHAIDVEAPDPGWN